MYSSLGWQEGAKLQLTLKNGDMLLSDVALHPKQLFDRKIREQILDTFFIKRKYGVQKYGIVGKCIVVNEDGGCFASVRSNISEISQLVEWRDPEKYRDILFDPIKDRQFPYEYPYHNLDERNVHVDGDDPIYKDFN